MFRLSAIAQLRPCLVVVRRTNRSELRKGLVQEAIVAMTTPTPHFFYFDLGNVLLKFDQAVACRQMADVAGISAERVREIVFDDGMQLAYERGLLSTSGFYEAFCERSGVRPSLADLVHAASDIFELDAAVAGIAERLRASGHRLGILSNTCEAHWEFCAGSRFPLLDAAFDVAVLSYQIGSLKPETAIYEAATELARANPEEIFFVDDRAENVAGALEAGFDAVQFTSADGLIRELLRRDVCLDR